MLLLLLNAIVLLSLCSLISLAAAAPQPLSSSLPTSANCTWHFIDQPLSHFERGNAEKTFIKQRLCVYDAYWTPNTAQPVFLYTGNESPVEVYVNNTGLLWTLAEKYNALIVFAEHRYFGESIPDIDGLENCIAYLSSAEALADYASLSNKIRREWGGRKSAIIAFGGSYGGMLASYLRMLYPSSVDGAIAASAPVWGFPLNLGCPLDGSAKTVTFAASVDGGSAPNCRNNLKSSYVLIADIGKTSEGRDLLSSAMGLCSSLQSSQDVSSFISYLQGPLFNLAEGSYPFASDYITSALTGTDAKLPAWAMQQACNTSGLDIDYNVLLSGDEESVKFSISVGNIKVDVDWNDLSNNGYSIDDVKSSGALKLAAASAQAMQIWYNVTKTAPSCIDWNGSYSSKSNQLMTMATHTPSFKNDATLPRPLLPKKPPTSSSSTTTTSSLFVKRGADSQDNKCTLPKENFDSGTAWNVLTCNEGINLVNWRAQGVGNDLYWPPNQERGYSRESIIPGSLLYCGYLESIGLYGAPKKGDDWSVWIDTMYGGERMQYASNIFYSNGNLDPWSPAGVVNKDEKGRRAPIRQKKTEVGVGGGGVTAEDVLLEPIKSVTIDRGGHHLDLFFASSEDPQSVKDVRDLEEKYIVSWINQVKEYNQI